MVVHDLDVVSIAFRPSEADAPLLVDPYSPFSSTVTAEALETIPRRNPEIFQGNRCIELPQFAQSDALQAWIEPPDHPALEEPPSCSGSPTHDNASRYDAQAHFLGRALPPEDRALLSLARQR